MGYVVLSTVVDKTKYEGKGWQGRKARIRCDECKEAWEVDDFDFEPYFKAMTCPKCGKWLCDKCRPEHACG